MKSLENMTRIQESAIVGKTGRIFTCISLQCLDSYDNKGYGSLRSYVPYLSMSVSTRTAVK